MRPTFEAEPELRPEFARIIKGEYDIPKLQFDRPPIVLDCGANAGAFTVWATKVRWPGCKVIAYEPHPKSAGIFRRNCPEVTLHEKAILGGGIRNPMGFITHPPLPDTIRLFDGLNNSGEASLTDFGAQKDTFHDVRTVWAGDLPNCDFLKIDTEGAELAILQDYKFLHNVQGVALEFHNPADQWKIGQILTESGFTCALHSFWRTGTGGLMKWRRA